MPQNCKHRAPAADLRLFMFNWTLSDIIIIAIYYKDVGACHVPSVLCIDLLELYAYDCNPKIQKQKQ